MSEYYVTFSNFRQIDLVDNHFDRVRRKRILSFFIDLAIYSLAYSAMLALIYLANTENFADTGKLNLFIRFWFLYQIFHLTFTNGMTFGMRYTKLRLIGISGEKPHQLSTMILPVIAGFLYLAAIFAPFDFIAYFSGEQEGISGVSFWSLIFLLLPFVNYKKRMLQDYICRVVFIRSDV